MQSKWAALHTRAPSPPELPPHVRHVSYGLDVRPNCQLCVSVHMPRPGMFVTHSNTAPAPRIARTASASSSARTARREYSPDDQIFPRTAKISFTVNGTPSRGRSRARRMSASSSSSLTNSTPSCSSSVASPPTAVSWRIARVRDWLPSLVNNAAVVLLFTEADARVDERCFRLSCKLTPWLLRLKPLSTPAAIRRASFASRSAASASFNAAAKLSSVTAFTIGFTSLMRAIYASTTARLLIWRITRIRLVLIHQLHK